MDFLTLLQNFLDKENRLTAFPAKRKMKLYALCYLAGKFETGKRYTEREVNDLLNQWHTFEDPATLRRELYNHRFLDRERNSRTYWKEEVQPTFEELEKKYG